METFTIEWALSSTEINNNIFKLIVGSGATNINMEKMGLYIEKDAYLMSSIDGGKGNITIAYERRE